MLRCPFQATSVYLGKQPATKLEVKYNKALGLRHDQLEKGATVLDLGCGTGYLTKVLSERVGPEGKVVAVDPDGERLKIARENHSASNFVGPNFLDLILHGKAIHLDANEYKSLATDAGFKQASITLAAQSIHNGITWTST